LATVGIIANPASGKDIRRLVALGLTVDNNEKVNIVRRALTGLHAAGVDEVVFMPDYFAIGRKAVDGLHLDLPTSILDMRVRGTQQDSTDAARLMAEMGVGCIITIGGDGTNRAVAKTCGDVPLVPISTGTNNVFPFMIEGTLAGLAAGVIARGLVPVEEVTGRTKRLDIVRDGETIDIALIDAVVYDDVFVASRAIWDVSKVRAMVLTRAEASNIGMSSIGGDLRCAERGMEYGVAIRLGKGPIQVTAPIAPGLIDQVTITAYRLLAVGDSVEVIDKPSLLALDGEREISVQPEMQVSIRLSDRGPLVVDMGKALHEAAQSNAFTRALWPVSDRARVFTNRTCLLLEGRVCLTPCVEVMEKEYPPALAGLRPSQEGA
jgi:predicted polyphosphate/ATP-dependent NAD kinase